MTAKGVLGRGFSLITKSEQETRELARRLARVLKPGAVLCLSGPLGSGKTRFVQGLAAGLGLHGRITSPTFTLVREYRGRGLTLHHLDLYRVGARDLRLMGWEDYLDDPRAVCAIEWSEKAEAGLPPDRLEVAIDPVGESERRITVRATGPRSRKVASTFRAKAG